MNLKNFYSSLNVFNSDKCILVYNFIDFRKYYYLYIFNYLRSL